jgi:glycosyltransferase involved in cell wall biosynthesis
MRVHLLALPHTVTHPEWSHCAFTQKVVRLSPMLRAQGIHVTHYGNEGSASGADVDVTIMGNAAQEALLGHALEPHGAKFFGDDANATTALYQHWNATARAALEELVAPGDVILLPFGWGHDAAVRDLPVLARGAAAIESGIGYFDCCLPWRIYESHAVRHVVMAKEGRHGVQPDGPRMETVIPNYYAVDEWPLADGGPALVFMARILEGKGVPTVLAMARARPDVPVVLAGQGNPLEWGPLPSNVHYVGPVIGRRRAELLGNALAIVCPSRYVEPFGGVTIEAALCGTPAITADFGCYTETIEPGVTGVRCTAIDEYVDAIETVRGLHRPTVRARAVARYAMPVVGQQYARVLARAQSVALAGGYPSAVA